MPRALVDVSQVEPMAHSFPIYNVFREDQPRDGLDRDGQDIGEVGDDEVG